MDIKDLLDKLADQRNKALDEAAQLHAEIVSLRRELKEKLKEPVKPAEECASS